MGNHYEKTASKFLTTEDVVGMALSREQDHGDGQGFQSSIKGV